MATINADQEARATPLSCDAILRIAHQDAERAYGDLSAYRITLALAPDGWHVDYEPLGMAVAGGGPHYVIRPSDGKILASRYEQ